MIVEGGAEHFKTKELDEFQGSATKSGRHMSLASLVHKCSVCIEPKYAMIYCIVLICMNGFHLSVVMKAKLMFPIG